MCTLYRCILWCVNYISVLKRHHSEREKARLSVGEDIHHTCNHRDINHGCEGGLVSRTCQKKQTKPKRTNKNTGQKTQPYRKMGKRREQTCDKRIANKYLQKCSTSLLRTMENPNPKPCETPIITVTLKKTEKTPGLYTFHLPQWGPTALTSDLVLFGFERYILLSLASFNLTFLKLIHVDARSNRSSTWVAALYNIV